MNIIVWNNLTETQQLQCLMRPTWAEQNALKQQVADIISQVKQKGDTALYQLTQSFDQVKLTSLTVLPHEMTEAYQQISREAQQAIEFAKVQITAHHALQVPTSYRIETHSDMLCERQIRPIQHIGLYIPGGSAPLVSTVMMLAIPANIAGCKLKILCTPPQADGTIDPHLLVTADLCGIRHIYKIGGAQAVAAMAYGSATVPKVDKIFGPGNRFVTQAKLLVAEDPMGASIDMPAGPSELMVIADSDANPEYVAADLLSQAEHGADSQVILLTPSGSFAEKVNNALDRQLQTLSRKSIIKQALAHSKIILVQDIDAAIEISNRYAPEHLILQIDSPEQAISHIHHAGSVFLGPWSPETLGDYVTGSNHVLPTYGYARSYSGLSVMDYMKWITFQKVSKNGLQKMGPYAEILAKMEGLDAHQNAVAIRMAEDACLL